MKLLVFTRFHPFIGGLETVMEILTEQWAATGHQVQVATDVPADPAAASRRFPFPVHHQPSTGRLLSLVRWCDVYLQGCVGLKTLWPLGIYRRLYVASHQTWYEEHDGSRNWQNDLKHFVARYAVNVAPSRAIADRLSAPCTVIPNPYRSDIFKQLPDSVRDRDLIFVGRLVSDKGATLLLQAVAGLARDGLRPSVTLVGDGPERPVLEREAADLGIAPQVRFTGAKPPEEVAALLNRHRVFVVPSRWNEPFGVVALEGIACGCLVVGSQGGGLKDAIGPCGLTFPNGDVPALRARLQTLLHSQREEIVRPEAVRQHLVRHQPAVVAKNYVDVMLAAANR